MSGIEIAGLAVGVLPILVEVVKSYSALSKKLHTMRHYSKDVKSISEQLKVHNGIFLNEVRLLLRSIEDEEEVESMLEGKNDQRWTSQQLNDRLSIVLRGSFDICCGIVEEAKSIIESMRKEMEKFDILLEQRSKGESIKATLKRVRGSVKFTFDKSRHERTLASLRDRNGELKTLRSQIGAFRRGEVQTTTACIQHKALPTKLSSIHDASHRLHEALCRAWCCDDAAHRGHYAKLCIDAEVEAEVRLDLVISCYDPSMKEKDCSSQKPPIWLHVQSMSTSRGAHVQQATMPLLTNSRPSLPYDLLSSFAINSAKQKASIDVQQESPCRKKVKRVHFVDPPAGLSRGRPDSTISIQALTPELDLCQTKNFCKYLQRHYEDFGVANARRCIGYLETPELYKHLFYFRDGERSISSGPKKTQVANVYSVFDTMRRDADEVLAVEDQLKLAHKTALAVLQFNDTPWLSDHWRLRDMSYFGSKSLFDEEALKTLHFSSQISAPAATTVINSMMDGIERVEDAVSDQVRYGINNTTLFFLGVALLEIAHWKPIEEKMTPRDLNNEVFAARRLAAGRAPLGPQYQKIAEKCLQCNFGFGTKLSNRGLQTAVYNDVVCELESMIEKLTV